MDRQPAGAVSFITAASEKAIPSLLGMYGWFCTFRETSLQGAIREVKEELEYCLLPEVKN